MTRLARPSLSIGGVVSRRVTMARVVQGQETLWKHWMGLLDWDLGWMRKEEMIDKEKDGG